MMIESLTVFLHQREIGYLTRLPGERLLWTFHEDYIHDENRPTLSLSFKDQLGGLLTSIRPTQTRVPPFFSNLLPEGRLREYLAKQAGVKPTREFYLLHLLGSDLPGAIKVISSEESSHEPKLFQEGHVAFDMNAALHFSLAGVQLKFSAIKENNRQLTIPANGVGGSWIVKLPDARYQQVPENEYAMMTLARAVGIDTPEVALMPLDFIEGLPSEFFEQETQALVIKRFDRTDEGERVHIEDFAQILNVYPERKYEQASYRTLVEIIRQEVGENGVQEFIKRLVFNVLIGNGDMHLKNWSLIYPDQKTPVIAPAYDFVSTIAYIKNDTLALSLGGEKKFSEVTRKTFSRLANKAGLPEKFVLDNVSETCDRFSDHWAQAKHYGVDKELKSVIDNHLKTLRL